MKTTLRFLGALSAILMVGSLMVMNSAPARVDLVLIEGDVAVFMVIAVSFLLGFFTCLLYQLLRRMVGHTKKLRRTDKTHPAEKFGEKFGEI